MKTHFVLGDWNAICDMCAHKRKASTLKRVYVANNFSHMACPECWERDHPANIPPHQRVGEGGPVPWARPDRTVFADTIIQESEEDGIILLDDDTGAILLE